jgi:broad specificity phosphatase PhoE
MEDSRRHEVLIVRHSERIDEVDKDSWKIAVEQYDGNRNKGDFSKDPCLTSNGITIAAGMAITTKKWLTANKWVLGRVYCSKLRRCIETASMLVKELNVPLYVSYGLALTSKSVEERNGGFEFFSIEDLTDLYPGIEFVDCDEVAPDSDAWVPRLNWFEALHHLAERHEHCVIVAHSETVKNLLGPSKVPYCSLSKFTYELRNSDVTESITDDTKKEDDEDISSSLKHFLYNFTLSSNGELFDA